MVRKLAEMGAEIVVHDPYVQHWWEFEKQEPIRPRATRGRRFFRNQEKLNELRICKNLRKPSEQADAVVLAVRHKAYLQT